jgi:hypothetical protein
MSSMNASTGCYTVTGHSAAKPVHRPGLLFGAPESKVE